jgi:hypothetical protein
MADIKTTSAKMNKRKPARKKGKLQWWQAKKRQATQERLQAKIEGSQEKVDVKMDTTINTVQERMVAMMKAMIGPCSLN